MRQGKKAHISKKSARVVLALIVCTHLYCHSQEATDTTFPSPFQIGLGFGVNHTNMRQYDYYISPLDNTLQRDEIDGTSAVGSVVLAFTPLFTIEKESKMVKAPGPISIVSSFNLAQLNSSTGFNAKLSGGLGLAMNIQNAFLIGLFCDFTQVQMLRSGLQDSLGKKLVVNEIPLVTMDRNDSRYFRTEFIKSISLKFVYVITRRNTDIKSGVGKDSRYSYSMFKKQNQQSNKQ
jgi:hypothetical protein